MWVVRNGSTLAPHARSLRGAVSVEPQDVLHHPTKQGTEHVPSMGAKRVEGRPVVREARAVAPDTEGPDVPSTVLDVAQAGDVSNGTDALLVILPSWCLLSAEKGQLA